MANFACCKTKPIPAYYICENCLNIYHRACTLKNRNKFKFIKDHKIQCCDLTTQTEEEISLLEQTIEELNDETLAKNRYIEKQNKDMKEMMQEAIRQEEEMNQLIATLEKELGEAKVRITELNGIINSVVKKDTNTIAVQTNSVKQISRNCQTTSTNTPFDESQNNKNFIQPNEQSLKTPKMLIVAGSIGRNLANIISKETMEYQCQAIIKPGALDIDLLNTALNNTKNFTKKDIVIIWTSELHIQIIDKFLLKLKYTNPIVLTKPYEYGKNETQNYKIYQSNIFFLKQLFERNISMQHVIECNAVLRRSNYSTNGQYIRNTGKLFIAKKIISHIHNNFVGEERKPYEEESNQNMFDYLGKHIPTKGDDENLSEDFITQVKTTKKGQLYPNLQEMSLLETAEQMTMDINLLDEISSASDRIPQRKESNMENENFLLKKWNALHIT